MSDSQDSESQELVAERYRLVRKIGSGGMGRVWLARDEVLHRDVAVKEVVLPADLSADERDDLFQRTMREARAAGRLNHPNVVAVFDVVQDRGRPWIVMELVLSRSLYQVIRQDGPVSPRRAAEIGLAVLAALRAAHRAGVWHRDVKPGNVLLADDGRVVLTDFGLATYDGDGTVTRAGLILGSAQYISPERARDGASGPESDMWSLGAMLYAAVEGRSPYARESSMATLTALATQPPDPPRRAGPLRPVLIGLLRKNPRHRMRAPEVEKLLKRIVAGEVSRGRRQRSIPDMAEVHAEVLTAVAAMEPATVGVPRRGLAVDARISTATEETYRYVPSRRHRRWLIPVLAVVLAVPVALIGRAALSSIAPEPTSPGPAPSASTPLAAIATAAMGVQACAGPGLPNETAVPDGGARAGEYALLPGWTYYRDPAGYHVAVPQGWRAAHVGTLLCLRDPSSLKAIAVLDQGGLNGSPADLLAQGEAGWRSAADLTDYHRVGITDAHYDEGAADLEYTYSRAGTTMHGENRMLRLDGRVFTLFWLTTDFSWTSDIALMQFLQPSFGLDAG